MTEAQQAIQDIRTRWTEFNRIFDRPTRYMMADLDEWVQKHRDTVSTLLDDAYNAADEEYPYQQQILNAELEEAHASR